MARVLSTRNREKMVHDGSLFCFEALDVTETVKFWRCDRRFLDGCKARIHTLVSTGEVIKEINQHCHGSDAAGAEVRALLTAMKRRAEETQDSPVVIINELCQGVSPAVMGQLPSIASMKKMIQRRRIVLKATQPESST